MRSRLEHYFRFAEHATNWRTEILASMRHCSGMKRVHRRRRRRGECQMKALARRLNLSWPRKEGEPVVPARRSITTSDLRTRAG